MGDSRRIRSRVGGTLRQQRALRDREAEFRRLVASLSDYVWSAEVNADGSFRYRYRSPVVEKITGRPPEYFTPERGWMTVVHPDDRGHVDAVFQEIIRLPSGSHRTEHYRIVHSDGTVRWVSDRVTVTRSNAAWPVILNGVLSDITEEIESEIALRESEERFRALTEATFEAVAIHEQGEILDANPAASKLLGYQGGESIVGRLMQNFPCLRERPPVLGHILEPEEKPFEFEGKRIDGSPLVVEVRGKPIRYQGRAAQVIALRDITEKRHTEAVLRQAARELARSNRDLEAYAYVASHDLQEPLRMVSCYLKLIQRKCQTMEEPDKEMLEFLAYATDGAIRMRDLISGLLTYAQLDSRIRSRVPTDCREVVQGVLQSLRLAIAESGAQISVGCLPAVTGDRVQLGQLFQNLISNAIKFSGEAPPKIVVGAERNGDEWIFRVADQGIGIPPESKHRLFVLFQRLHRAGKYGGTGVGLAICKKIVERHSGRIWVESSPGKGSCFCFALPADESLAEGGREESRAGSVS